MNPGRRRWTEPEAAAPLDFRLAVPALAVWAGCLVAFWASMWWVGALALMAVAAALVMRSRYLYVVVAVAACAMAAALGAGLQLASAHRDPLMTAAVTGRWVTVELDVVADPVPMVNRFSADASARWRIPARSRSVTVADGVVAVRSGVTVTVFGDGPTWGGSVPREVLRVSGVAGVDLFAAVPGATIRARGDPVWVAGPPWWASWAASARRSLTAIADGMEPDRGGLLRGLVVGDTRGMSQRLQDDAKTSGLAHLVAVSGSHMAIVAGMVLVVFRRWGPRVSSALTVVAVIGMVVLVGPEPSVIRSAVMGLVAAVGVMAGRAKATVPVLAATVMVLLYWDPSLAVSVGFTLSVLATAALVLVAPVWIELLQRRGVPRGWATVIVVPLAAHLATVPVIASFSGAVSLVAVIANIAVTPVVAPALLIGLGCLVFAPWWPAAAGLLATVDGPLVGWIITVAHGTAAWPGASVTWSTGAIGALGLVVIVLGGAIMLRVGVVRSVVAAAAVGALAVVLPVRAVSPGWPAAQWVITGCDVGQGDGMVLPTGVPGTVVVVDTGTEAAPITACLRDLGATQVGMLVLTHIHDDHIGGAAGVIRDFGVSMIGVGPEMVGDPAFAEVAAAAEQRAVPVVELRRGQRWTAGDLGLDILGPERPFHGTASDENNDSVVMMASYRGVRTLLTGDIEVEAQTALLRSGVDLRAEVLKQPHHGSARVLPEFLAAVSPQVAVIGVGADNTYGHPAETALMVDRAAGVEVILRTDHGGDVQVVLTDEGLATVSRRDSGS